MRKTDPLKFDEKKREILAAATRCFLRDGLQGASIAQICAEANTGAGPRPEGEHRLTAHSSARPDQARPARRHSRFQAGSHHHGGAPDFTVGCGAGEGVCRG